MTFKTLEAWKKSMQLVNDIYVITKTFPKEEVYSLTSQIKRAAISIPSNIAEGIGRNYKKETIQFLHVSRGSLYELETQMNIACMVKFINEDDLTNYTEKIDECRKIINGMISYYEKSSLN